MNDHAQGVQATAEAAILSASSKMTAGGSAVSVASWFTESSIGLWAGIFIGFAGLGVKWFYEHRRDKREQERHEAELKAFPIKRDEPPMESEKDSGFGI